MSDQVKKILVVDDEADVHEFVKAALEGDGVAFVDAVDGEEALAKVATEKPDLVILDVQMPKKDGFQVFAELKKNDDTASIPVIMLTAINSQQKLSFDASDLGKFVGKEPEAFVDKPIEPEVLLGTANKLLGL